MIIPSQPLITCHAQRPNRPSMSGTESAAAVACDGDDRRRELLQVFAKAGVKSLLDAGVTAIPSIFHHPPDSLQGIASPPTSLDDGPAGIAPPPSSVDDAAAIIPVVDLSCARREDVVAQLRHAAGTVGFFQVVNHGVPAELMAAMLAGVRRFNEGPDEAKRALYTKDARCKVRFNPHFDFFQSRAANWRDTLSCEMAPDSPPQPEELPEAVRIVMVEYCAAVTKLAQWVFELLSESLGLASGHLCDMGCAERLTVLSHYYPPCPEPHLTLGTSKHADATFLTFVLQDGMGGLQVLLDRGDGRRGWVDVPPLPGALVVNIGDLFQLVSNDRFRSVQHRVLANKSLDTPRVSVACFFCTDHESTTRLCPITDGINPLLYRSVTTREFITRFYSKGLDVDGCLLDDFRSEIGGAP